MSLYFRSEWYDDRYGPFYQLVDLSPSLLCVFALPLTYVLLCLLICGTGTCVCWSLSSTATTPTTASSAPVAVTSCSRRTACPRSCSSSDATPSRRTRRLVRPQTNYRYTFTVTRLPLHFKYRYTLDTVTCIYIPGTTLLIFFTLSAVPLHLAVTRTYTVPVTCTTATLTYVYSYAALGLNVYYRYTCIHVLPLTCISVVAYLPLYEHTIFTVTR